MTKAWTVRPPCLRGTYSWCRGEASRRDLAQSCAWIGDVARGRSRATARSLRALGTVIVMGRSLVRSVQNGQDGEDDLCRGPVWRENRSGFQPLGFCLADYLGRPTPADKRHPLGTPASAQAGMERAFGARGGFD